MSEAHTTSDEAAILAAHDRRFANAQMSFDAACRACRVRPTRWAIERVKSALLGLSDEYLAGLERVAGRERGSFPRLSEETVRAPCVEAWEDGPHGVGMSDKVARAYRSLTECEPGVAHQWHDTGDSEMCAACCMTRTTVTVSTAPSRPPEREEPSGRTAETQDGRGGSTGAVGGLREVSPQRRCTCFDTHPPSETCPTCEDQFLEVWRRNPSPIMPERGERVPLHPEKGPCQKSSTDQPLGHPDTPKTGVLGPVGASMLRIGNALAEERGITHASDSPVLTRAQSDFGRRVPRRYMPPVDPTIAAEDPA